MGKDASLIIRIIGILISMPLAGAIAIHDLTLGLLCYALQVPLAIDTLIGWYKYKSKS
jgi:hypothetical protein